MECSSPRDWDGLAESSWIYFPHYTFSRLNGSVSLIPVFCGAVPVGFIFPCFFSPFWRAQGVLWSYSLFCNNDASVPKDTWQTLSLPFPCPTLSSSWDPEFTWGSEMFLCSLHTWGGPRCWHHTGWPCPTQSVSVPSWTAPFTGELCSLYSTWHHHCKSSKNLVPLKIPAVGQVWLKLANWFGSY